MPAPSVGPTIAESVVDERASIIRHSLRSSSSSSDLDKEDENMSNETHGDGEQRGLEDVRVRTCGSWRGWGKFNGMQKIRPNDPAKISCSEWPFCSLLTYFSSSLSLARMQGKSCILPFILHPSHPFPLPLPAPPGRDHGDPI